MNAEYLVRLDSFEGPLDLLLHLVEKNEMDIYNIPIAEITEQYLSYLNAMQELRLDIASEFLVMAATLLAIKSNMLLPKPEPLELDDVFDMMDEGMDPRQLLMERLLEYKKFKYLAAELQQREIHRSNVYTRPPGDLTPFIPDEEPNPVKGVSLYDLLDAFRSALLKAVEEEEPVARIRRDEVSVKERTFEILDFLQFHSGQASFQSLLSRYRRRSEIVVTFLAVLELIKNRKIQCRQEGLFSDILLHLVV
ncbi:segregation and condensation protein A [Effusibacillus lacus]|uniref:Segregation and condensation protein A n=1 Tax=Effusibacillus lacus TaxID=1348429 RepID=A0A292YTS6_9BACL|nr:segregation/condensation protein A [Effusibacillus lacus]TCS76296.1 condensin subunit ScpA [Effusibacillus lacus]GAX91844.1 segregation/condensation protein A [Effusibacillus lacus]